VPDLAHRTLDLLIDGERGIWHAANRGEVSWARFALLGAKYAGLSSTLVQAASSEELNFAAERPPYSVLGSEKANVMPPLEDAIHRYMHECVIEWRGTALQTA
jgi:dTDP-4-dehydrorhamnose reductase